MVSVYFKGGLYYLVMLNVVVKIINPPFSKNNIDIDIM